MNSYSLRNAFLVSLIFNSVLEKAANLVLSSGTKITRKKITRKRKTRRKAKRSIMMQRKPNKLLEQRSGK